MSPSNSPGSTGAAPAGMSSWRAPHGKKGADGRAERLALLAPAFGETPAQFAAARPKKEVGYDDVLDAFAALWSA
jgi:hypothetical protein